MNIEPYTPEFYLNEINPLQKDTFSNEQLLEIQRVLKISMARSDPKATKINFYFWFYRLYFVDLIIGVERRNKKRRKEDFKTKYSYMSVEKCFEFINKDIKSTLSFEQTKEIKRLIGLSGEHLRKDIKKKTFNIWFLKFYYVDLFYGREKRSFSRRINDFSKISKGFSVLSLLLSFSFGLILFWIIFYYLYLYKSYMGIDIFEDAHLYDLKDPSKWKNFHF